MLPLLLLQDAVDIGLGSDDHDKEQRDGSQQLRNQPQPLLHLPHDQLQLILAATKPKRKPTLFSAALREEFSALLNAMWPADEAGWLTFSGKRGKGDQRIIAWTLAMARKLAKRKYCGDNATLVETFIKKCGNFRNKCLALRCMPPTPSVVLL